MKVTPPEGEESVENHAPWGLNETHVLRRCGLGCPTPLGRGLVGAPPPSRSHVPADDFVLLLCAAQQWRVFEAERTEEWLRAAGENADRLDLARDPRNPTPNFIHCRWAPGAGAAWGAWGRGDGTPSLGWDPLPWGGTPWGMDRMGPPGSGTCWAGVPQDGDGTPPVLGPLWARVALP